MLNKFIALLLIVLTLNSNAYSLEVERGNCTHAICPGNFSCPREYYFYRRADSCCYDCTLSCKNIVCQKIESCPGEGNYLIPAGGRFCCDRCNLHPYF